MAKAHPAKRKARGHKNPGARVRKTLADEKRAPWASHLDLLSEIALAGEAARPVRRILEVIAQIQSAEASLAAGKPTLPPGLNPHEAPSLSGASFEDALRHFIATRITELGTWLAKATPEHLLALGKVRAARPLRELPDGGWIVPPADPGLMAVVQVAHAALELRDQSAALEPAQYLEEPTLKELTEWWFKVDPATRAEIARAHGIDDSTIRRVFNEATGGKGKPGVKSESR